MTKRDAALFAPAVFGILLIAIASADLKLYRRGHVSVSTMLTLELPLVVLGLISSFVVLCAAIVFLFKKQWRRTMYAIGSSAIFVICFVAGGISGAAYLNAT